MTEEQRTKIMKRNGTEASRNSLYRAVNLSFCPLSDSVIVLDPKQGLYFRMTPELAAFLQSLPESESDGTSLYESSSETPVTQNIEVLMRFGLLVKEGKQTPYTGNPVVTGEISVWGTVSELTQMTPPPPPTSGPPA